MNALHAGMSAAPLMTAARVAAGVTSLTCQKRASILGLLLGWEYIGLTGDYVWSTADQPLAGAIRPLRRRQFLLAA
jgi:hypothetical protein